MSGVPFSTSGTLGCLLSWCVQESKVGLRWRTEQEVVVGKGQFACGAKGCDERRALASYEVRSLHALQLKWNSGSATVMYACLCASLCFVVSRPLKQLAYAQMNLAYCLCVVVSSPFEQLAYVQVNFAYKEAGEHKQALVKLRLCPKHALQLNHKQNHKLIKKRKREQENAQAHVSKQPAHSSRDEMSPDVQDNAGSGGSSDAAAQVPDAAQASKLLDHKCRRSKQHEVFDGLFD